MVRASVHGPSSPRCSKLRLRPPGKVEFRRAPAPFWEKLYAIQPLIHVSRGNQAAYVKQIFQYDLNSMHRVHYAPPPPSPAKAPPCRSSRPSQRRPRNPATALSRSRSSRRIPPCLASYHTSIRSSSSRRTPYLLPNGPTMNPPLRASSTRYSCLHTGAG